MVLTEAEQAFLAQQRHLRLATIGRDGSPQVKPVGFRYNAELGTIDIRGFDMAASAKYRNVQANPKVALVGDDVPHPEKGPAGVRFLEIRGEAETTTAPVPEGAGYGAGLPPDIIRVHPQRILSAGIEPGVSGLQARNVSASPAASLLTRHQRHSDTAIAVSAAHPCQRAGRALPPRQVASTRT